MTNPGAPARRAGTRLVIRAGLQAVLVLLFIIAALLGTVSGVLFAYASDLPEISALDDYRPHTITRLLARDGQEVGEFAIERRVVIGYDDMAPVLRQAIIATEDGGFERHFGISVSRMIITAIRDVLTGERYGASTITQQLSRTLFLTEYMKDGVFARSGLTGLERKAKEILVAIQIEKRFTKRGEDPGGVDTAKPHADNDDPFLHFHLHHELRIDLPYHDRGRSAVQCHNHAKQEGGQGVGRESRQIAMPVDIRRLLGYFSPAQWQ